MEAIKEFTLDRRGLDYIKAHLTNINVLCTALLEVVISTPGEIFTLAPADASEDRLYDFRSGGLLASNRDLSDAVKVSGGWMKRVETLNEHLASRYFDIMKLCPQSICIVDDFNPRWDEPLARTWPTAFGVGQEVYHVLTPRTSQSEIARLVVKCDTIWHGVAAVCHAPVRPTVSDQVPADFLREIAADVIELSCTAYDGEGFVGWRPPRR